MCWEENNKRAKFCCQYVIKMDVGNAWFEHADCIELEIEYYMKMSKEIGSTSLNISKLDHRWICLTSETIHRR
jgi:hypothetical protein